MTKPRETLGPPVSAGFGPPDTTDIVPDFASDEAAELWHSAGRPVLGAQSGKTGYTVADVRAATEED